MARMWLKLAGALACLAAPAGLALAQPNRPTTTETAPPDLFTPGEGGGVVHRASGYLFPEKLGDMPRRKYRIFAPDDVEVNYTLRGGGNGDPWLDVFVYPAPRSVEEEAAAVERELVKNLAGTRLAAQPQAPPNAPGAKAGWFEGRYEGRLLTSGYVLVKRGRWYLLARGSSPKEAGAEGLARLLAAIAAIDWRWTGETPRLSSANPWVHPLMHPSARSI